MTLGTAELIRNANRDGLAVPAFNIPYLPMMRPVIQAVIDEDTFALIEIARLEWVKFEAEGPAAVAAEFAKWQRPEYVRLHWTTSRSSTKTTWRWTTCPSSARPSGSATSPS